MEKVKYDNASGGSVKRYISPRAEVVFVKVQGVICNSPYGENTERITVGDYNYDESDWD